MNRLINPPRLAWTGTPLADGTKIALRADTRGNRFGFRTAFGPAYVTLTDPKDRYATHVPYLIANSPVLVPEAVFTVRTWDSLPGSQGSVRIPRSQHITLQGSNGKYASIVDSTGIYSCNETDPNNARVLWLDLTKGARTMCYDAGTNLGTFRKWELPRSGVGFSYETGLFFQVQASYSNVWDGPVYYGIANGGGLYGDESYFTLELVGDAGVSAPPVGCRLLTHCQNVGDQTVVANQFGGTRGQSLRMEGFQINLDPVLPGLSCRYMAHVSNVGDVPWVNEGQFMGFRGQSRAIEGFAIELTGANAGSYALTYMASLAGKGDTPMCSGGQFCGTRGEGRAVEGMLVRIDLK